MAQTVIITLTTAGADTGPFDLYSNIDGFSVPFESNVAKVDLEGGYVSSLVPDSASTIRVQSESVLCSNFVDLGIAVTTTTTTTPTPTTTTTTIGPTTTTTTTLNEIELRMQLFENVTGNPTWETNFGSGAVILSVLGNLSSDNNEIATVSSLSALVNKTNNDGDGPNGVPTSAGSVKWLKNGVQMFCKNFNTSGGTSSQALTYTYTGLVVGDLLRIEVYEDGTSC